jgi:uncharacterized protein DUF6881
MLLPGTAKLGPPISWFHGVWVSAPDSEPVDWFDELDALRWSIRCVRRFRDGSMRAHSYASSDWRDEMPQAPVPPLEEINSNPEFRAREITKEEFEILWEAANRQCKADPQDHHHMDELARWMVVHEDTHGNRGLTKSDLTEPEADAILARFAQNKPHKQEYYKFSYTPSTRRRVILRERILE